MEICISRAGKLICNLINETIGGHVKVIIHHVVIFATYMNNLNSARRPPFYLIVFFCGKKKIIINRDLYFFLIHFWSFSSTKESSINRWFNFACENLGEIFVKKFYLIIIDIENKKSICDMHDDVQEKERKCRHSLIKHLHFSKISIIWV